MKLIDINKELRNNYKDTVVIMKYENFYKCFYNDSLVMNYIFNYKQNENRIGFPIINKDKVENKLNIKIKY